MFPDNDDYDIWQFPRLHKIILGLNGGNLEECLLEPGTNIDDTDSEGITALAWASIRGDSRATVLLLKAQASINKANCRGDTPLTLTRDLSCLKLLLEAGANIKARNHFASTTLHRLSRRSNQSNPLETVQFLISAGADIEAKDNFGGTPLALTSHNYDHISWTRALLDCGANIDATDNDGDTSLHNAIYYRKDNIVALLLQRGAAYILLNKNGDSILHMTARYGNLQIIQVLETATLRDLDTETLNKQGKTARQEAEERDSKPVGFLEKFDELLAGVRARFKSSHRGPADGTSTENGHVDDVEDKFVDALEEQ